MVHTHPALARAVLLVALAACGARAPAAPPAPGPTAPLPAAAPAFDGLFRAGASWRFAVTHETSHWDDADPDADARGNVHSTSTSEVGCRVTETVRLARGRASELACDEGADWRVVERVAGVWIQTADGLWSDTTLPDDDEVATLDLADRFLPADPKPEHTETTDEVTDDGPAMGSGSSHDVEASGDGWCVTDTSWGGDESWQKLCLDADGPASGGTGHSGGATDDVTFERIER